LRSKTSRRKEEALPRDRASAGWDNDARIALGIFVAALLLRLLYFADYINTRVYPFAPFSDGYYYYVWARDIVCGDILGRGVFMKWPLYGYLLGLLFALSNVNVSLVYLLQFALGAVNSALVFTIGRRLFSRPAGIAAAVLYLAYLPVIFYEGLLLYVGLSLFLNSLLFLYLLRVAQNPDGKRLFQAGILSGIGALTVGNALLFGVAAAGWIVLRQKLPWRRMLRGGLCFGAGVGLMIGIATVRNYVVAGDLVPVAGNMGFGFYVGNNEQATGTFLIPDAITLNQEDMFRDAAIIARRETGRELKASEVSRFWMDKSLAFIRQHPAAYLKLLLKKTAYAFNTAEYVPDAEFEVITQDVKIARYLWRDMVLLMPFGLLGFFLTLRRKSEVRLLHIACGAFVVPLLLFLFSSKFRVTLAPFLAVFAGYGLMYCWQTLRQKNTLRVFLLVGALALFFFWDTAGMKTLVRPVDGQTQVFNVHLERAMSYEQREKYPEALRELLAASLAKPDNRRVLFRQGVVYYQLGRFDLAEQKFQKIINAAPDFVDAYFNLGFLYNQQEKFAAAAQLLEKAIELYSDRADAHFQLAMAYKHLGNTSAAKSHLQEARRYSSAWRTADVEMIGQELQALNAP